MLHLSGRQAGPKCLDEQPLPQHRCLVVLQRKLGVFVLVLGGGDATAETPIQPYSHTVILPYFHNCYWHTIYRTQLRNITPQTPLHTHLIVHTSSPLTLLHNHHTHHPHSHSLTITTHILNHPSHSLTITTHILTPHTSSLTITTHIHTHTPSPSS